MLSRHSKYFWLHLCRRYQIVDQLARYDAVRWDQEDYWSFRREFSAIKWHYHRLTLAILKFGARGSQDMALLPPRWTGTSGYSVPEEANDQDHADLFRSVYLNVA